MALDNDIDNLARLPLFAALEPMALRSLAARAETRLLRAGDRLFRRGEDSDGGYILAQGSIAVETDDDGRPAAKILHPWTLIGETALIAATARPITATAREPTTVFRIARPVFHGVLEEYPTSALRVRSYFAERLRDISKSLIFAAEPEA